MNEALKINPFPGLRPFAEEESDLFFGRERESHEVLEKLMANHFVTVIGASGTGKSSLIYCGVLPRVRDKGLSGSIPWRVIKFRPGSDPFGNLAESIAENLIGRGLHKSSADSILLDMHLEADGIYSTLQKYISHDGGNVLLVVDQFEELFRYGTLTAGDSRGVRAAEFVNKIVKAVSRADSNIYTLITMRSDFIGECSHYQGLTQLINNSNYLVPHMDRENYRQVIEGPVKYVGATIDPKLVETILNDIGERTDQLPVLQHAMMRTWTYWQELSEPGRPVSHTDYDSVGTMSDAMSRHANEAFEELDQRGREICEKMFRTITEKGADNKGIRHPSSIGMIKSIIQCSSEELYLVVEKFRIPSRSFITPRQDILLSDETIIDLSHESLMRLWDRLRDWVENEFASVQMYLRLSEASAMYQQGKTSLLRPPDLQLAINWRDQQKPTLTWAQRYDPAFERAMVYLRTSEKDYLEEEESKKRLQRRQIRRTKIVAMILGGAAIISGLFMIFAFIQKVAADKASQYAQERERMEKDQRVAADSAKAFAERQRSLAVFNADLAYQREMEADKERQEADRQKNRAIFSEGVALDEKKNAMVQRDSATIASLRAKRQEQIATTERNEARRLRMLSIGKSMSVKSLQVIGQKDLQTLLAYQAYLFNKKNGGLPNDADIYNGLYNVAQQFGNQNYKTYSHDGIKSVAFVPGKNEFFTSGSDNQIRKWSLEGNKQTYQVIYQGSEIIEVLAVSPDASWLAAGSDKSTIHMIPLKGDNVEYTLSGHSRNIRSLIFSYDGKYLYSAALDGKVLKWDLSTRTSKDITTGSGKITSIDISSTGKYLAGINQEENVILWNPESVSDSFRLPTELREIKTIRFKPDENILAIGDVNGYVELWDVSTRQKKIGIKAHVAGITDIKFNPVLNQMATASHDNSFKIYNNLDDLTEQPLTFYDEDAGFVIVVQFSPDGQMIVSGTYEKGKNIIGRPTHADLLANDICTIVSRNLTQDEWNLYVGKDIALEKTCEQVKDYNIKVNVVK
jgi:WD40 repeat protein